MLEPTLLIRTAMANTTFSLALSGLSIIENIRKQPYSRQKCVAKPTLFCLKCASSASADAYPRKTWYSILTRFYTYFLYSRFFSSLFILYFCAISIGNANTYSVHQFKINSINHHRCQPQPPTHSTYTTYEHQQIKCEWVVYMCNFGINICILCTQTHMPIYINVYV